MLKKIINYIIGNPKPEELIIKHIEILKEIKKTWAIIYTTEYDVSCNSYCNSCYLCYKNKCLGKEVAKNIEKLDKNLLKIKENLK